MSISRNLNRIVMPREKSEQEATQQSEIFICSMERVRICGYQKIFRVGS